MPSSYFCKNNNLDLKTLKGKQARLDYNGTIFGGTIQILQLLRLVKSEKSKSTYREKNLLIEGECKNKAHFPKSRLKDYLLYTWNKLSSIIFQNHKCYFK